ncbi:DUF2599 domain-containing protein [Cryobacterium breve]|uniref:DUF2599 domain-containing protein n=1 Tax=Cryobacterium breve TaxID=1259258 RepID=A0ABY2J5H7_9MICO|nr:DUF2599 domain-containing protein [Cryobacterium sp. TmT3-12]TFC99627.1 DUF2599 domain-containing protein [Cryobacterium breve]
MITALLFWLNAGPRAVRKRHELDISLKSTESHTRTLGARDRDVGRRTVGTYNFSHAYGSAIWESYKSLVPAKYEAETMRKQLICHASNIGAVKNPWNLETPRANVRCADFVLNLCNPN